MDKVLLFWTCFLSKSSVVSGFISGATNLVCAITRAAVLLWIGRGVFENYRLRSIDSLLGSWTLTPTRFAQTTTTITIEY